MSAHHMGHMGGWWRRTWWELPGPRLTLTVERWPRVCGSILWVRL